MKGGSLARRYARALIRIGIEQQSFEQLGQELDQFAALLTGHQGLESTLSNPSYDLPRRRAVLEALLERLRPSQIIRNFLMMALDRDRMDSVPGIAMEYQKMADEHAGRLRAEVTAAKQSELAQLDELKRALEKTTGKKIVLSSSVDADLIAGKVTRIGSLLLDGSIRTRLEQLGTALLAGKI